MKTYQTKTGRIMVGTEPRNRLKGAAVFVAKTNDNDENLIMVARRRAWTEQGEHTTTDNLSRIDTICKVSEPIENEEFMFVFEPAA